MAKIDLKDRKLLYHLSINARESHKKLAKMIGLSENSVKYRINRLLKEGVIDNFTATINLSTLGYSTSTMLLRFNEDIYSNKEITDYFKNHKSVIWIASLSGQWDLFIEFAIKDYRDLIRIVSGIRENFEESLNTYKIFFSNDTLRVEHLVKDFYSNLDLPTLPKKERVRGAVKLDKKDYKILNLLTTDSSLSYMQIAKELNLTFDIVRYRIKNFIEKGVVVKFFPEIDFNILGYAQYLFRISLESTSNEKFSQLKSEISNNPNITYAFHDANTNSFLFVCSFESIGDVDHLSRGLRKKYSEIIREQEYLILKEDLFFNLFPRCLLKES